MTNLITGNASPERPAGNPSDLAPDQTSPWSAHNLPKPAPSRTMRFSVIGVAAALVAVVLASALAGPIRTAGSKMEPGRFQASAEKSTATVKAASAMTPFAVASMPAHR